MLIVHSYPIAVMLCVLTMICWGSWANMQKLAARSWRFELFYWDFVLGLVVTSLVVALTLGSTGESGRTFIADIQQADASSIGWAFLGGIVWNAGNLLLVAAIAIAGMAIGFPIGGGIAWVLGILVSFGLVKFAGGVNPGNTGMLFVGVGVIIIAIVICMAAYKQLTSAVKQGGMKGIVLSITAGLFIAFFYGLVVKASDPLYVSGGTGKLMPLTATFFFTVGAFLSTILFNSFFMRKPVEGPSVAFVEYFKAGLRTHLTGIFGGAIWSLGISASFIAVGAAGPAVSYALSNAAPVVAILWGVLVWREFSAAPRKVNLQLAGMFLCFLVGLVLITCSRL